MENGNNDNFNGNGFDLGGNSSSSSSGNSNDSGASGIDASSSGGNGNDNRSGNGATGSSDSSGDGIANADSGASDKPGAGSNPGSGAESGFSDSNEVSGNGSGRRRGRGRPRRSNSNSSSNSSGNASGRATEENQPLETDNFRTVNAPKVGGFERKSESSKEKKADFVFTKGEVIELTSWLFMTIASLTKKPYWQLQDFEAKELGAKIYDCQVLFPKTIAKKYEKQLSKYVPVVSLLITASMIMMPRINQTLLEGKQQNDFSRIDDRNADATSGATNPVQNSTMPANGHAENVSYKANWGYNRNIRSAVNGAWSN